MAFRMLPVRTARTLRAAATPMPQMRRYATNPPNPTSQFYKTFTRPVAKVLLVAVFTYQLVYWGWVKLETDEVIAETDAEIEKLETTVKEYEKKTKGEAPAAGKSR